MADASRIIIPVLGEGMAAPAKVDELVERFGRNLDAFKSIKRDCLDQRCYAFSNLIQRDQNMNLSLHVLSLAASSL